ncbi:tyrosine-type recombinase/integrase [Albimonas sp. CAU 1670]|uniref:tyrosine-type recombinase/integrase n=1 Tax=Albimonas sp. CAU 1670 TaxID=3032599 RepID=UPI0023D99851|nr:site-specific integrase [Albimonas sp. CAU 1670]MDF2235111.1 tyrosine-type recombinase/integrase [Albimonas sp. CAU 1670]
MSIKLNETYCKNIAAPESGNKVHYDSQLPGFGLRVTASGAKSFVLNYHVNGRERRMTIGRHPAWSAAAARERAKELRRDVDNGLDPLAERNERRSAPTVRSLWSEYETVHLPTLSDRSRRDQRSMWQKDILPTLGAVLLADLSSKQIDELHSEISARAKTRANRVLEVLRKALNLAVRWGWIEKNPAEGFRRNAEHARERYLTEAEYELVFSALEEMPNQRAANAIRLLILTGARRGEVLSLEWQDLDLVRGIWNRPAHKSKDRRPKRIPLSSGALALLHQMREIASHRYLFPTSRGTCMPDINRPWSWLKRETGLVSLRVHDLRHSFASVLISNGETLETIGKLLGHSQHQTTLRYAHLMDDPLRRAADKLANTIRQ